MSELRELYQTTILDHNKQPRNFRVLEPSTHELRVLNLGDSGAMLLRPAARRLAGARGQNVLWPRVALRTSDQTHYFNCPYQLSYPDLEEGTDYAEDAEVFDIAVQPGDVLVMGSDGVFDNVFPAEVERVLNAHPGVVESGVVGVPHPHTGESVKAFIVAEPGRVLEEDDLIEWCATELARYKCPTKIDLVDEIPRGLGGKIIRRELGA